MNFLGHFITPSSKPLFIAELSCNHCGSLPNLLKLMDAAKAAKADIIKIQVYTPEEMTLKLKNNIIRKGQWKGRNIYELYEKAHTPPEWVEAIFAHSSNIGIPVFASVFGDHSLAYLEKCNCPAYKIASMEAEDVDLLRLVMNTGKPIMVSSGASKFQEIQLIHNTVLATYPAIYMHCVAKYPCPDEQANMGRIKYFQSAFGIVNTGYSDHTRGYRAAEIATALGAKFIERHFHDPVLGKSEDSKFSLKPDQFKSMVIKCNKIFDMMQANEAVYTETAELKRSLHIVNKLKEGSIIHNNDVRSLRGNKGMKPVYKSVVIGRSVKQTLVPGTPLRREYLND